MRHLILTLLTITATASVAVADDERASDADAALEAQKALYSYYFQEAAAYAFSLDSQPAEAKLTLEPRSLMNWTLADSYNGSVFVWTHKGRARLIGCIGSHPVEGDRISAFHEFHALAETPLVPVRIRDGQRQWRWSPAGGGVELRPVPDTPTPAKSEAGRLVQMRQLARQFTAHMLADEDPWVLRMLAQPLYRYPGRDDPKTDGAVFAWLWTKGTDPEFLLVLETRETDSGLAWHWAPARFTWRELWLEHAGQEVWRVERHGEHWQSLELHEPYVTVPVLPVGMEQVRATVEARNE